MSTLLQRALVASAALCALFPVTLSTVSAQADPPRTAEQPLTVTVTANRGPTALQRTGSAVTVIPAAEIARSNPTNLADVLRSVPGLDISETGGAGSVATVRLRGANAGQTLVLLDGLRINDASGPSGEFDLATLAPGLIDRIEVLRGPQSALYGSDAIGGVVNIITKKGRGEPVRSLSIEGGSYGTLTASGSIAGSSGPWSYAFAALGQRSDGFSRYGYRIGRLERTQGPFEPDGFARLGGFGRVGYDPGSGFRFDVAVTSVHTRQDYDAAFGRFPDTPSTGERHFTQASARAEFDAFDGLLTHAVQLYVNRTERHFTDVSYNQVGALRTESRSTTDFTSDRRGAEYQATLRLKQFGTLIAGGRVERETADSFGQAILPVPGLNLRTLAAGQTTSSAFFLWQLPLGERLSFSFGGRYDKISDGGTFPTYRATVAYRLPETGSKLRASVGTGAKAATLFQRFSPQFGTAGLSPEKSIGVDAGIDQDLFGGRVTVSLTGFHNRLENLIDFQSGPPCRANQTFGCFVNVARATTSGLEASGKAVIVEGWLSASGAYTYLHAKDDRTGLTLARRPQHAGRFALQITPTPQWLIEPAITMVGERFSGAGETGRLAPYARLDLYSEYRFDKVWKAHVRVENITNAKYQDVLSFGTAGRSIYAGLSATW
jgi:vitamin B12 transporter